MAGKSVHLYLFAPAGQVHRDRAVGRPAADRDEIHHQMAGGAGGRRAHRRHRPPALVAKNGRAGLERARAAPDGENRAVGLAGGRADDQR